RPGGARRSLAASSLGWRAPTGRARARARQRSRRDLRRRTDGQPRLALRRGRARVPAPSRRRWSHRHRRHPRSARRQRRRRAHRAPRRSRHRRVGSGGSRRRPDRGRAGGGRGVRRFAVVGAVLLATGVALGAFGAHGLEGRITADRLATFETAVRYQLVHGVGLLALAGVAPVARVARVAAPALRAGALLFAVTLYLLAVGGPSWLGAVAPSGGAAMIAGWVAAALDLARG